jgi:Cof subfamily protein (haloacid dehalogenase superfamily)
MKKPRYDMLVIDLDGTLLCRDGSVSTRNAEAIVRARDAGIEVVIATGRALVESRHCLDAIEYAGVLVAAGGSMLTCVDTGRTLQRRVLRISVVEDVTETLVGHGHKVLILKDADVAGYDYLTVGPGDLDAASKWWFAQLPVEVRHIEHCALDPHPDDSVRAAVVAHGGHIAPIAESLRKRLNGQAHLQHWSAVTETHATGGETHLLEVFHPDVNKWTMVESYGAEKGIFRDRIAAIGDGLNDVELIREAGLGIAMANADPRAAAVADRLTGDHDQHGVADAIDRIVTGEW